MEEKAKKGAENSTALKEEKKLTYEELENVCHQLSEQSRTLYKKLQEANLTNMFKRLDYLFKVLENAHCFVDREDFLTACVDEIAESLTIDDGEGKKKEE